MYHFFGDCQLNTEQYVLSRAGQSTSLQPKVFQVLEYLLLHRDRVVSKQELCDQIWPDQFISDASIEGVIKAVRQVVGDDGRTQWCIQTRRSQGYQFIASLSSGDHTDLNAQEIEVPCIEMEYTVESPVAMRRQLTVMCCEMVEAASLVQSFDPEELRDVVLAYQSMYQPVIERFKGVIAREDGTGVMAYFGYPTAYEDAAYCAVRAGLEIVHHTAALSCRLKRDLSVKLSRRVGIHTGLVVVEARDSEVAREPSIIGAPLHVAEQIQRVADPHAVLISTDTAEQVQGLFISREIEPRMPLAAEFPSLLVHVLRHSLAQNRFDVARHRGLTPLIGREEELSLLQQRWKQVEQGHGQGALLYGEAGIGKSRLAEAFREQVERQGCDWAVLRCTSTTQQSAFYPVLVHLRQRLQWSSSVSTDTQLDTLETMLQVCGLHVDETVPLIAPLLMVPLGERYRLTPLPPDVQHRKTLETLLTWLLQEAVSYPGLMIWEDIHWADSSTLELLSRLLGQIPTVPVLVLLTFRPDFQPSWPLRSYLAHLALHRLNRDQVIEMITREAAGLLLPDEVTEEVFNKSDGVPLFVEELIKLILESQVMDQESGQYVLSQPVIAKLAIPATLQNLLMARLDQLGTARRALQFGSLLGREFSYHLIRAVMPASEDELQESLARLVEAELLYQQGVGPQLIYLFKHALIQDAAYQSILKRHRREYHGRIAQVLEEQFLELVNHQPEVLARHYTEAGQPAQAVVYWQRAGQSALSRFAYMEAVEYSDIGLKLLAGMPTTTTLMQHELVFQTTLGKAHAATKGFGALEVEQAYKRALELCRQMGESQQRLPILGALRSFYAQRGEWRTARELAEEQLSVAEDQNQPILLVQAYADLGTTLLFLGELGDARENLQQGRCLLKVVDHDDRSALRDSRLFCLSFLAFTLLFSGDVDQASACQQETLRLAQELTQPFGLSFALGMSAMFHLIRREHQDAQRDLDAVLALAREQGFELHIATGEIMQVFMAADDGLGEAELTSLHQSLAARVREAGFPLLFFFLLLAELYQRIGQTAAGLCVLTEVKEIMTAREEYSFEAEWFRIKGELLLQQAVPDMTQAEACFQQAIAVARRQHAKWWEIRAATRLAQLWQQQNKQEDAYLLLSRIYASFTEGFDTLDLQEAEVLLGQLTS